MQAFHSNPRSEIYWITDDDHTSVSYATKVSISGLMDEADQLAGIYSHQSINTHEFELFCFQRWFVLKEFMARYSIASCLALDSDVLLYSSTNEMEKHLGEFELAVSEEGSPHCLFVNSQQAIQEICESIMETFKLIKANKAVGSHLSQLSDMTIFDAFTKANKHRVALINSIRDGTTIDHNIQCDHGFTMLDGRKKILWKKRKPYGFIRSTGESVRFHALHLQGAGKSEIGDYYNQLK